MGKASREKGKRGEREVAHFIQGYGIPARRGQQFSGKNGDADVVGLEGVHIEVKRVERLNIENAMAQSIGDALEGEVPVVFHRKDRGKWLVTMLASDFMTAYEKCQKQKEQ